MNKFSERIQAFRLIMKKEKVDVTYIPTNDYHNSEYVGDFFKVREYLTGFTGSAGILLVTQNEACLFTDGRYFIQAEHELLGSGVTLFRSGMEGVPTPEAKLSELLKDGGTFGFDGRLLSYASVLSFETLFKRQNKVHLRSDFVYPSELWSERPLLNSKPAFVLETKFTGKSISEKLSLVREYMKNVKPDAFYQDQVPVSPESMHQNSNEAAATHYVLSSLDEIAWLFNLRGDDVLYTPVVLSFALITASEAYVYLLSSAVTDELRDSLQKEGVQIRPYQQIYTDLNTLANASVLLNTKAVNASLVSALPPHTLILSASGPILLEKAIKNPVEQKNLKAAHVKDGIAVTRFMYWLKTNIGKEEITEYSAAEKLLSFRRALSGFIEPSFETISAYNENAAMMHYTATKSKTSVLSPQGFLLVDSGGQYFEGTMDITRNIVLGELPLEWKKHYTAVLRGMLALTSAKFLYGCRGVNLDILARGPLWQMGLDYRCGTGHGVGYFLGVHEAPNGFRWRIVPERNDSCVLEEGMVTTNEPGVYVEGSHGIRIENELLCKKAEKTEYGQFMCFETLTMAPIDLDAVLIEDLSASEKETLNNYHRTVFETLREHLSPEEQLWLQNATRTI